MALALEPINLVSIPAITVLSHLQFVVSEMTYTVLSGMLNSTIPYHLQFTTRIRLLCT